MAEFSKMALTTKGLALQSKAQTGVQLNFTKVQFGDGTLAEGESILNITSLKNSKMTTTISSNKVISDGTSQIRTILSNSELTQGFYLREVGVFAQDPDEGEILYAYTNSGEYADFIPAGTGSTIVENTFDLIVIVGNASNVTAVIPSGGYVSHQDWEEKNQEIDSQMADMAYNINRNASMVMNNDWTTALQNAINYCKQNGLNAIYFPTGNYHIASTITIDIPISIIGDGYYSIITCDNTITFTADDIYIRDLKITYTGSDTLLYLTGRYEIYHIWLHASADAGVLLKAYAGSLCGISRCLFTQVTVQGTATGTEFFGDDSNGAKNTDVSFCKFSLLNIAIQCKGSATGTNYVNACGYRFISNMIISCSTALYAKNVDYLLFENSMIDYAITPVYIENVNNLKFRHNYVATTHTGGIKLIELKKTLSHNTLFAEISENHLSNGTYTASTNPIESYGIYVCADAQTLDQISIHNNSFVRLTYSIYLCTVNNGKITNSSIINNQCDSAVYYITLADINVQNSLVKNNTFNTLNVSFNITDNGIGTIQGKVSVKSFSVTISANTNTKLVASGIPLANIISGFFIYNEAVYYLNPLITFDSNGNLYIKAINMQTIDYTLNVKVLYKY